MSNTETPMGLFVDALTGETITRELTTDEKATLANSQIEVSSDLAD